jgi:hypothetical protein
VAEVFTFAQTKGVTMTDPHTLVLIHCSRTKEVGGVNYYLGPQFSQDPALMAMRLRMNQLSGTGVPLGPDFGIRGQCPPEAYYMSAAYRYQGRMYKAWGAYRANKHVLIVSALYGIVRPDEPIQAYDLYLTYKDAALWRPVLTPLLYKYCLDHAYLSILPLFADEMYYNMLDWEALPGRVGGLDMLAYHGYMLRGMVNSQINVYSEELNA